MRAAFQVWHVGDEPDCSRHLVMYEHGNRDPHEIDRFPMGSRKINELMPIVREAIQPAVLSGDVETFARCVSAYWSQKKLMAGDGVEHLRAKLDEARILGERMHIGHGTQQHALRVAGAAG